MKVCIQPSIVSGTLYAPASKSAMQRACALALLNEEYTLISNPGKSNDDSAALSIIQSLGAEIEEIDANQLKVKSRFGQQVQPMIDCGESGLSIRMFTPIAALLDREVNITGRGSLVNRPMHFFDEVLPSLHVDIRTNKGRLPLQIKGPLIPGEITIDGSVSSQFLTGLLIAFGYACKQPTTINVNNLNSRPYIDLTLKMMNDFGYTVLNHDYRLFEITPGRIPRQVNCNVEGDWSGAAFLLVAGAIAGNILVKGLDVFSKQADIAILQALMSAGALLSVEPEQIEVRRAILKPFHFNATQCPDLFPPLVALAAGIDGMSVIEGVGRLEHKESNRGLTLQQEFGKLGIRIDLQDDLMVIHGGQLTGALTSSCDDHRIAMAIAVAALAADGETWIDHAEAVNKSYPAFYDHLIELGGNILIID